MRHELRILYPRQTLTRRPGDPLPVLRIPGTVAGAVPGAVGRVPGQGTAQMSTGGAEAFVYCFLFFFRGKRFLQGQV